MSSLDSGSPYIKDVVRHALSKTEVHQRFAELEEARRSVLTEGLRVPAFGQRIVTLLRDETCTSGTTTRLGIRKKEADRILDELRTAFPGIVEAIDQLQALSIPPQETEAIEARRRVADQISRFRINDREIERIWRETHQPTTSSEEIDRVRDLKSVIVNGSLRLVFQPASKLCGRHGRMSDYDEIVQGGNIGLMRAVERFDGGGCFSTYAYEWISQGIGVAMRTVLEGPLRLPRRDPRTTQLVTEAQDLVRAAGGDVFDVDNIFPVVRDRVGEGAPSRRGIQDVIDRGRLQTPTAKPFYDIASEVELEAPAEEGALNDVKELVKQGLSRLGATDRRMLELYFGLTGEAPMILQEIGSMAGITREAVRQRIERAKANLREAIGEQNNK
jgi:RNA polymerase primary sigma factor